MIAAATRQNCSSSSIIVDQRPSPTHFQITPMCAYYIGTLFNQFLFFLSALKRAVSIHILYLIYCLSLLFSLGMVIFSVCKLSHQVSSSSSCTFLLILLASSTILLKS